MTAVRQRYRIPFNRPSLQGPELTFVAQAIANGHISGDGAFTEACSALLERELPVPRAMLTTSCTDALEMAALLLEIGGDHEIIVPSFTFVSTANAFVLRGATPVFCDIRPDTLNLDERVLEARITARTKAIVVVHYAGVSCDLSAILAIAHRHGVPVVEDNAHGLFGRYHGRHLGTFGRLSTQSFHETKNFSCGEGGALLINDPSLVQRAEIIREKGTNRSRLFRGEVDKYSWIDVGSSYLPSDLLAAFLLAQLEAREEIQRKRQWLWNYYNEQLADWATNHGIRRPTIPPDCQQSYHMFYLLMPSPAARAALMEHLKQHSMLAVSHYVPLHLSAMGAAFGARPGDCPVAEVTSDTLVRLPFYTDMSEAEIEEVVGAVRAFQPPAVSRS